ncbi:MAG: putative N-acetylmannosamine-6-phosphate 2-epimerase [Chroococcopsis gigantea SAG 12.99]|nr:putative N-acetylmannosamine-6-phosphate 2-epimerase [Chroococcopsis gigantea SAG 12.99]
MDLNTLKSGLIVSCQAPAESPLHEPMIIAAIAFSCVNHGAVGVRIDSPSHVESVRQQLPDTPIIGLWKRHYPDCEVYITPRLDDGIKIASSGADIIAIDATLRKRPHDETMSNIIEGIHKQYGKLVMADVDSIDSAKAAVKAGADMVGTTLYGYTKETEHLTPPGLGLLEEMAQILDVPIICEGGIATPEQAKKALELGAFAVVVGTAITGIDLKTQAFKAVFPV